METQTVERLPAKGTTGAPAVVMYLGAAAFVIAVAWFWLVTKAVTVAPAPRVAPGVTAQRGMHIYYRWLVTTLPQERFYTSIAIAGFGCLAVAAFYLRDRLGRDRVPARIGAVTIGAGALLWVTGSVLQLGGHRAIGLMATHANPIETTNSIAFTIDTVAEAFALAAFALIGVGMLAFAAAAERPRHRAWAGYTAVVALALLVTAGSYAVGAGNLQDLLLAAGGVVLLPLWLVWTGRTGETRAPGFGGDGHAS